MGSYLFQAKTVDGKLVRGEVAAASEAEARVKLRAQKLLPVQLMVKGSTAGKTSTQTYGKWMRKNFKSSHDNLPF